MLDRQFPHMDNPRIVKGVYVQMLTYHYNYTDKRIALPTA